MEVIVSAEVGAPPEAVFAFLAHQPNHARIFAENVASRQVGDGPMGVGARVENEARVMGQSMIERFEITEFDPPRRIGKASREGSTFETTDRFELEPAGDDATRVTVTVTGTPRHLGHRLLFVALSPVMRRSLRRALAELDRLVRESAE